MENIFSNYGIEIVVGMIVSVLVFLFWCFFFLESYISVTSKKSQKINDVN